MNILGLLQSVLYLIMNALLYPVIVLLILLIITVLFILGNFVSEYAFRRRRRPDADQGKEELAERISHEIMLADPEAASQHIEKYLDQSETRGRLLGDFFKDFASQISKGRDNLDIRAEKALQKYEIMFSGLLDKTRMMVRIGPMLGLMGTLIPMGPALLALTKGDLTQMANCLIIAFGTTVSGLAVGAAAYLISVVRERWYSQDMKDMEYLVDMVMGYIEKHDQSEEKEEKKAAVLPMARG